MLDTPESDIRQKHDPIGLVNFVNVLKNKSVKNSNDNEARYGSKTIVDKDTKSTAKNKIEALDDEEDLVNYKVGRLVMSILKEFQVSTLLEKFEKVLVQNANIIEDLPSTKNTSKIEKIKDTKDISTTSKNKKTHSKNIKSNYANHRGTIFKTSSRSCLHIYSFNIFQVKSN